MIDADSWSGNRLSNRTSIRDILLQPRIILPSRLMNPAQMLQRPFVCVVSGEKVRLAYRLDVHQRTNVADWHIAVCVDVLDRDARVASDHQT